MFYAFQDEIDWAIEQNSEPALYISDTLSQISFVAAHSSNLQVDIPPYSDTTFLLRPTHRHSISLNTARLAEKQWLRLSKSLVWFGRDRTHDLLQSREARHPETNK